MGVGGQAEQGPEHDEQHDERGGTHGALPQCEVDLQSAAYRPGNQQDLTFQSVNST
jgi:hypothetical protein